jgi:hypothetical protein
MIYEEIYHRSNISGFNFSELLKFKEKYENFQDYTERDFVMHIIRFNPEIIDILPEYLLGDLNYMAWLIHRNFYILRYIPENTKKNHEFIYGVIQFILSGPLFDPRDLFDALPKSFLDDKHYVTKVIDEINQPSIMLYASHRLTDDENLIKKTILRNPDSVRYIKVASKRILDDFDIMKDLIDSYPIHLKPYVIHLFIANASERLKDNDVFISNAIKFKNSEAFLHASKRLAGDPEIALTAILYNPLSWEATSRELKESLSFRFKVIKAVGNLYFSFF